jgi:hypothetical protein
MRPRRRWPRHEVRRAIGCGLLVAAVAAGLLLMMILAIGLL